MNWLAPRTIVGNRGDLLSRYGILEALQRLGTGRLTVACDRPADLADLDLNTVPLGRLFNLWPSPEGWDALKQSDLILWTGGLDLQDDSSLLKLVHTWITFGLYRLLGCRIWLVMQGAGPLTTRPGRFVARQLLNLVERCIVRDSGSLNLLRGLKAQTRLERAHDGIFLPGLDRLTGDPSEQEQVRRITSRKAGQPLIGLNVRLWFHFGSSILPYHLARKRYHARAQARMEELLNAAVDLTSKLRRELDARVCLLSMYEPNTYPCEDDLPYLERIKQAFADDADVVLVDEPLGLGAFCDVMRELDLMIGCRLHSTLTALRFGVPSINLSYTNKCRDIFSDLGLASCAVNLTTFMEEPNTVARLASELLAERGLRGRIQQRIQAVVRENEQVLRDAFAARPIRLAA